VIAGSGIAIENFTPMTDFALTAKLVEAFELSAHCRARLARIRFNE
jgi:hypothetical protein